MKKLLSGIRHGWRQLVKRWHRHRPAVQRWLHPRLPFLKRLGARATRLVYGTAATLLLLLATVYVGTRLWLPTVVEKKPEIEAWLSRKSAHQVRIEGLETYWRGWYPGVRLNNVSVYAGGMTVPAVKLRELHLSLDWTALLWGEVRIDRLRVVGPKLSFERLRDGRYRVTGFAPVEAKDDNRGETFIALLLRQNWLEVSDGELQWVDHRDPERVQHFRNVNLTLINSGDRHRLDFRAAFPEALCRDCSVEADIRGNPFLHESWRGRVRLLAVGLNVAALPAILTERLPKGLAGELSVDVDSRWRDGRLQEVRGHVRAADVRLPTRTLAEPVALRQASAMLRWRQREHGWRLEVDELRLALAGQAWDAGRLLVEQGRDGGLLELRRFDINDVSAFIAGLRLAREASPRWAAGLAAFTRVRPGGALADVRVVWKGLLSKPTDFNLESYVLNLTTEPFDEIPGVRNLTGRLSANPEGGEFLLDSTKLKVLLPQVFESPLEAERASGRFRLMRADDHWLLDGDELELEHPDARGKGRLVLRVPVDHALKPHLKLRVDFRDGNGAQAARYYPKDIPPATLAWLKQSFVSGRVVDGTLLYDGQAKDFPFHRGGGRFEIRARATNMVYAFLPGWKPLTAADAELRVDNARVEVRGAGRIGELHVDNISVDTALADAQSVRVGLRVRGPFDGFLRTLQEAQPAPGQNWKAAVPPTARGSGQGELNLRVDVPIHKGTTQITGDYQLRDAVLRLPAANIALDALNGKIGFTETGPREGRLQGRLLGGEMTVQIHTPRNGELHIGAHGLIRADGLTPLLGSAMAERVSGQAVWEASYRLRDGVPDFQASVALPGIKAKLPPPLSRPDGLTREPLVARTVVANRFQHQVEVRAGPELHGRLWFVNNAGGWRFARGRVGFGVARVPEAAVPGLHVQARIDALNLDDWKPYHRRDAGSDLPADLQRLSAEFGRLDALDRRFGRVVLDLARDARGWQGTVQGLTAGGRVRIDDPGAPRRVELDLVYLRLPEGRPGAPSRRADPGDPRRLPSLRLRAQDLIWKEQQLGRLEIDAEPLADGWSIGRFVLSRPEANFTASGTWRLAQARHQSEMNLAIHSDNAGTTLTALGIPDQLDRGKVDIRARLAWPGSPADFSPRLVRGDVEIKAEKGSFVQLKEGAGRLVGILDVSSILRVLTLDLNPIFGRGFVYDRVDGHVTLDGGNAYTRDFKMKGTVARVAIDGRVGLAKEDFDLRIVIDPQLSGTVATGTWALFGPGAAAAVLAFQKLFKRQISEGTRITYVVKGGWKNPTVDKILPKAPTPSDEKTAE